MEKATELSCVNEKLSFGKNFSAAFQHMLIAILSAFAGPLLIGSMAGLPSEATQSLLNAVLFTTGITSILTSLTIIPKMSTNMPMVMGAGFATLNVAVHALTNSADFAEGFQKIAGATIISGILCLLIAPLWSKLLGLFPPLVVATNIIVIGVALMPSSFSWIVTNGIADRKNLYLALFVLAVNVILSKFLKGFYSTLAPLFTILIGTVISAFFGFVDFTQVNEAPWLGLIKPFQYGLPKFDISTIIGFSIVTVLLMVEISGCTLGIYGICKKKAEEEDVKKIFSTTGVATFISGCFNSFMPTAFVQNIGLLDVSGIHSRFTTATAGVMLVIVSFLPKVAAFINIIPKPVLGGVGFALFGAVASSGISMLKDVDLNKSNGKLLVAISIGMAILPSVYPQFYSEFPELIQNIFGSGIVGGSLSAIVLNIIFNFSDIFKKTKSL